LFALLLFCIVFKVRTGLASAFSAARATSFVSILLFRPPVKRFFEGFCGFFAFFCDFRTISTFSRHHRSSFSEPSSLFPFSLFVRIIRRHLSACFHRQRTQKSSFPIEEGAFLCNLEITQSPWRAAWPDEPSYDWQHSCA